MLAVVKPTPTWVTGYGIVYRCANPFHDRWHSSWWMALLCGLWHRWCLYNQWLDGQL